MTTATKAPRGGLPTMDRAGLPLAIALVVLTNAVALGGVLLNRRDEPDAALTLTERELPIGYVGTEDTGLALHLDWNQGWDGVEPDGWLNRDKLQSLGFDCSVPPDDPRAELFYEKTLPLQRYAVLEFEGESWRRWLTDQEREIDRLREKVAKHREVEGTLKDREKRFAVDRVARSRLTIVDVGRDPGELRRIHPDRKHFIVAPAVIGLRHSREWKEPDGTVHRAYLHGEVSEILVTEIHVPLSLRAIPDQIRREDAKASAEGTKSWIEQRFGPGRGLAPRYEVILKYGRRHEPWIAEIRRLS